MARFLYFIEGDSPASVDGLPDCHPARLLAKANPVIRGVTSGPNDKPGCIIMAPEADDAERPTKHGYYPDKQEWKEYPGWAIGWQKDAMPGPSDLLRPDSVGGDALKLGDGKEWILPLLGPAWESNLPGVIVDLPEGGCGVVLRDEYLPLCKESEWWFDSFRQDGKYTLTRFMEFASAGLGVNYLAGKPEASVLKLFSTETGKHYEVVSVLIGLKRALEESKKNSQVGE